jgi:hypothetical protein
MKRYNKDPRIITAKFPSECHESGEAIAKGDEIIYWPSSPKAKVYKVGCAPKAEQEFREFQVLAFEEDHGYCTY